MIMIVILGDCSQGVFELCPEEGFMHHRVKTLPINTESEDLWMLVKR